MIWIFFIIIGFFVLLLVMAPLIMAFLPSDTANKLEKRFLNNDPK